MDGLSSSELGITASEMDSTEKKKTPVELPALTTEFVRDEKVTPQETFSSDVKDIVLVPMRAELQNGNLAHFLREFNEETQLGQDKIGLLIFLNDNQQDAEERRHIIDENDLSFRFLSLLEAKDSKGIKEIDVPDEYKKLAEEMLEKNKVEIRLDYAHRQSYRIKGFGDLRTHLFNLAKPFKNSANADEDIVIHLSDIDVNYSSSHFNKLKKFYSDPLHQANLSDEDFIPGIHEDTETEEDITRDMLSTLDVFRLHRYASEVNQLCLVLLQESRIVAPAVGTPMISGRLSYFLGEDDQLKPKFAKALRSPANEDWKLGKQILEDDSSNAIGNVGEVYRQHRARNITSKFGNARDDAEAAYFITKEVIDTGTTHGYNIEDISELGDQLEELVIKAGVPKEFMQSDEYRNDFKEALTNESNKVRLRRIRLFDYVDLLSKDKPMSATEEQIVEPFIKYFGDETETIKTMLKEDKSPEQIGVYFFKKYEAFFTTSDQLHMQIARARVLKKYALSLFHNQALPAAA
jgi:hypothetical protein